MRKTIKFVFLSIFSSIIVGLIGYWGKPALSLPPPEDIPEEILRTEIITEARSPIDGKRLTAAEYAQLQAQLRSIPPPKLDPQIRQQVFLLRIRKTLLQLFPFLDL